MIQLAPAKMSVIYDEISRKGNNHLDDFVNFGVTYIFTLARAIT